MTRNRIKISEHFSLHEFENNEGWCMVHPSVIVSLEAVRADMCKQYGEEVAIYITGSTRTEKRNRELAARYGYTDEGGAVSRTSKHLPEFGGVAVDFYAYKKSNGRRVSQKKLGEIARQYFDFVKDDYKDGHVHGDNRNKK